MAELGYELPVEANHTNKSSDVTHISRGWHVTYGIHLPCLRRNSISTDYVSQETYLLLCKVALGPFKLHMVFAEPFKDFPQVC